IGYMGQVDSKSVSRHQVEGLDAAERDQEFDSFGVGQPAAVDVLVAQGLELALELAEHLEIQIGLGIAVTQRAKVHGCQAYAAGNQFLVILVQRAVQAVNEYLAVARLAVTSLEVQRAKGNGQAVQSLD